MSIQNNAILTVIKKTPLLSQSASQLMTIMSDPGHTVAEITRIVECDAPLTAHLLRVINSAAYALPRPLASVARAVAYLGDKAITDLAMAFCCAEMYDKKLEGYLANRGEFWKHNLRTAIAAREVSRYVSKDLNMELAYTGAILHDIGKSVISDYVSKTPDVKIDYLDAGNYLEVEQRELETTHCEIGFELAKTWKLPNVLCEIIRWHHEPALAPEEFRHLAYVVHLGDIIAMMGGSGTGVDCFNYTIDPDYPNYVNLSADELAMLMLDVEQEFQKVNSSLFDNLEGQSDETNTDS